MSSRRRRMMMAMGGAGGDDDDDDDHHENEDDEEEEEMQRCSSRKPAWLEGLTRETFFEACGAHSDRRKNDKNIFCLNCCHSFCPHCLPSHHSHPFLQVRRYVYQDVVRLDDLEKLIDCSYVQPYTINSAKVIFLNQRAQSRSWKGSTNSCFTCDRILQHPFHFCSLSCKVDHMVYQGEDLSNIIYRIDETDFTCSQFEGLHMDTLELNDVDDDQITPNSILEDPVGFRRATSSSYCSSNNTTTSNAETSKAPDDVVIKKKKRSGFLPGIVFSLSNRRKGAPQRAPLS